MHLKCRGWDPVEKKLYSPVELFNLLGFFYEDTRAGVLQGNLITDSYGSRRPFKLLPFIGVTDREGKEIFEGDIVEYTWARYEPGWETTTGEVYFSEGIFYIDRLMEFAMNDCNFAKDSLKVLGNIYQNPELLKNP